MDRLTIPDKPIEGGMRRSVIDARAVKEQAMGIYWRLKAYEDTGLEPEEIRKWISVAERLPEEKELISDKVLIAQGVKDKQISFGWLRCGTWVTSDMVPFARQELITHWMPLPVGPENEDLMKERDGKRNNSSWSHEIQMREVR